jgi:hypothetical protein
MTHSLANAEAICRTERPLDWTSAQIKQFVAACRELACFHQQHSGVIKRPWLRGQ